MSKPDAGHGNGVEASPRSGIVAAAFGDEAGVLQNDGNRGRAGFSASCTYGRHPIFGATLMRKEIAVNWKVAKE